MLVILSLCVAIAALITAIHTLNRMPDVVEEPHREWIDMSQTIGSKKKRITIQNSNRSGQSKKKNTNTSGPKKD